MEQNFARGERKNAFGQTPATDVFEERAMKIMLCDFTPAELEVILRKTQELYMKCMPGQAHNKLRMFCVCLLISMGMAMTMHLMQIHFHPVRRLSQTEKRTHRQRHQAPQEG